MSHWNLFRGAKPIESELDSELRFHTDALTQEKIAAGLNPEEARREALLEFGGREQVKEDLRDVHRSAVLDHLRANLRSGVRLLYKSPSFSAAVILTLALGIGANTAVFSAINAVLLRPLPFPQADELMRLHQSNRSVKDPNTFVAPLRLTDWNQLNNTFQAISGWYTSDVSELSGALPEKVTEALVAPGFLQVWGVSPALGRDFKPKEERFGGSNAVLISNRFWHRRFNADPDILGKALRIEGFRYTIIGVMPASFLFPDHEVDFWVPNPMDAPYGQSRESTWFIVIGRLKPGITVDQARANMATVQSQLGRQYPKTDSHLEVVIEPLKNTMVGGFQNSLWFLFGSVTLLLLIACTNIAALLLARTAEREREISVRFSLGASRGSLIAQLLTESFVLALAGSGFGLLLATIGASALRSFAKSLPRAEEISLDWRILLYTLVCALFATVLCGLVPAIRGTRRSISSELAHASRTQVSTRGSLQWILVGVQVSLAAILLVGSGLLLRSFQELSRVSPGFEIQHILTFRVSGNWGETVDMKKLARRIDSTLDELRATPGVAAAAVSASIPGNPGDAMAEYKLLDGHTESSRKIFADSRFVSAGYFSTLKIPVLSGSVCRPSHDYEGLVVNRTFANTYFGDLPAVGHHIQLIGNQFVQSPSEICGIVADAREAGLTREPLPTVYWCVTASGPTPLFLVRTQGDPMAMAETLRRKIHSIEPARSTYDVSPLEQHLSDTFAENRLRMILLTLFALTAISLASVGLYGTLSYFVAIRKREIGLRIALGALREHIVTSFLLEGVGVALIGSIVGLALAAAFGRLLASMLFGVSTVDPETFALVLALMLVVAALASLLPAVRAARLEPMRVLRDE